ncbi:hypothetical protein [Sphingomonas sp. ERG5]|uniref:hypothetical protein n=1 Tax=Sphingomonas sp. ERG5 TaxID=1381597 RepID=UPI00054C024D|nr:hypothetical protein [Sphingomonas sp. ERG5]
MPTTSYTAYSLYSYNVSPVIGMAGRITDNGTTITPIPNMKTYSGTPGAGDPQLEGFADPSGNLRIAVAPYVGGTGETVEIRNALTGAIVGTPHTWASVDNLYGLVLVGSYLYAIDYDNARVVEINPTTYTQTGVTYTLSSSFFPAGNVPHGQGLINIGGTLYGLFSIANSSFTTYANSVLVRFTITGGSSISVAANDYNNSFGKNAFAMANQGSDLYVACIGGAQVGGTPNVNSALQKIAFGAANLATAAVTTVFGYSATYPYEVRDISFNGTTAYVLLGAYDAGFTMKGVLLQTTTAFSSFATINSFTGGAPGYYWAAQYIDNNRILFARGNEILYYNAASTGTPVATLTITGGSLKSAGTNYDTLNDMSYVGSRTTTPLAVRGYRSPTQVSRSARAIQARSIAQGRPELTADELRRLDEVAAES